MPIATPPIQSVWGRRDSGRFGGVSIAFRLIGALGLLSAVALTSLIAAVRFCQGRLSSSSLIVGATLTVNLNSSPAVISGATGGGDSAGRSTGRVGDEPGD